MSIETAKNKCFVCNGQTFDFDVTAKNLKAKS